MEQQEKKVVGLETLDTNPKSNEGSWLEVLHPTTRLPIGSKIKLLGKDSELYRSKQRQYLNRRLKDMGRGTQVKMTAEELEGQSTIQYALCTMAWEDIQLDGSVLECNFDNAKMLYERFEWLREQVDEFINDRANFL